MGVTLDELAIKTATLTRLGRMQEAVVFLRQGKALKAEQASHNQTTPCLFLGSPHLFLQTRARRSRRSRRATTKLRHTYS
eukprot:scaffold12021_cov107-Isochrysis_galbana.AAC.1